jgi:hypothetical protein
MNNANVGGGKSRGGRRLKKKLFKEPSVLLGRENLL